MATESSIRYDYRTILLRAFPAEQVEAGIADKVVGKRLGVSERQVRKARMGDGTVDSFLADAMCVGMGLPPYAVFGMEWDDVDLDVLEAEAVASEVRAAKKARAAS